MKTLSKTAEAIRLAPYWTPGSWKEKPATQQPSYSRDEDLHAIVTLLSKLPPLVTSWEVEALKEQLAEAAHGNRFLLQGGDCAESFEDCESTSIVNKLKILLQMSLILVHGGKKRVIRVGRFAGQYAKPRSCDAETRGTVTLPSYRGDMINRPGFTEADRTADPNLLLRAYERAALTLNFVRSLATSGFADVHHPENWDLEFMAHSPRSHEWRQMVASINESIRFMEALNGATLWELSRVEFFTSHEALHLLYEQAHTRQVPRRPGWYNLSTHFPWIGDRTRALGGAHIEYVRGIANPVGVKIGPSISPTELMELINIINPHNEPGRLTLVHRFGYDKIEQCLPPLVEAVQRSGKIVLWCCDPMHGNTVSTIKGVKTRNFDHILSELEQAFEIYARTKSYLGGVHFELTGEDVTECIGGASGLSEDDLHRTYKTLCDPRLNYEQSLEMALLIARRMAKMACH